MEKDNSRYIYQLLDVIPKIPKKINSDDINEILYQNHDIIKISTNKKNKKKKTDLKVIPHGFKICNVKTNIRDQDMKKIFIEMIDYYKKFFSKKYGSIKYVYETFSTFDKISNRKILHSFEQTMDVVNSTNKKYANILMGYFDNIMACFDVKKGSSKYNKIYKETYFGVFKYKQGNDGLSCHMDNFGMPKKEGYNQPGMLVTIGLGTDFYYDLIPVYFTDKEKKKHKYKPVRIKIFPNQIVIMDGAMRTMWQHCVPFGYFKDKIKITMKWKIPPIRKENKIYSGFFKRNIYTNYKKEK